MRLIPTAAALSLCVATSAVAQVGTYRPGSPYTALPAGAPDACERTCAGDAGCKGWNFVEMREGGVCELNSRDVPPVPSPNAVSGIAAVAQASSARLVRLPDSPTVRIGAPARRVVEPVSQRVTPKAATARVVKPVAPRPAPAQPRPRFSHAVESAPMPPMIRRVRPAPVMVPPQPAAQPTAAPAVSPFAPPPAAAPQAVEPPPTPAVAVPVRPVTQESLFGSLYDDVAVPAPARPEALSDPDAPVATAESRPVVEGLAGN